MWRADTSPRTCEKAKRLAWFVLLWLAGVACVAGVGFAVRAILH
ncbi:MAG TPA: DUF2474 domain-containing protein [Hyphomicrobiaceae bacterium]|nr:DUF2474 domain-containing protein [Hyphomicrobiaceae bacterium]